MAAHRLAPVLALLVAVGGMLGAPNQTARAQTESAYPAQSFAEEPLSYPATSTPAEAPVPLPSHDPAPVDTFPAAANTFPASPDRGQPFPPSPGAPDTGPLYEPYGSPEAMTAARAPGISYAEGRLRADEEWTWQLLPSGLIYRSYLAGNREPRLGSQLVYERSHGWLWEGAVGGRAGLFRYGTENDLYPQGWQVDVEGAAFPRLDLEHEEDLIASDYRAGILAATRQGAWEAKFGFYHLSSHIGDEFLLRFPNFPRINYVRESLVAGLAVFLDPSLRLYSEAGWCFQEDGGAKPWELQFGIDWSSPDMTGRWGSPFFAFNTHLYQDIDFSGNMTVQSGWQWRGRTGHLFRLGMQYFNGNSNQAQFYRRFEEQIGAGVWYDF